MRPLSSRGEGVSGRLVALVAGPLKTEFFFAASLIHGQFCSNTVLISPAINECLFYIYITYDRNIYILLDHTERFKVIIHRNCFYHILGLFSFKL